MKSKKSNKLNHRSGVTTRRMANLKHNNKVNYTSKKHTEKQIQNSERMTTSNSEKLYERKIGERNIELKHLPNVTRMTTRSVKKFDVPISNLQQENKNAAVEPINVNIIGKKKSSNKNEIVEFGENYDVFLTGDIVWAKLKGHPYWPAKVSRLFIFTKTLNIQKTLLKIFQ